MDKVKTRIVLYFSELKGHHKMEKMGWRVVVGCQQEVKMSEKDTLEEAGD